MAPKKIMQILALQFFSSFFICYFVWLVIGGKAGKVVTIVALEIKVSLVVACLRLRWPILLHNSPNSIQQCSKKLG